MFHLIQTEFPSKPLRTFQIAGHEITVTALIGLRWMAKCSSNWPYALAVIAFACCQGPECANRCATATVKEGSLGEMLSFTS